MSNPIMNQVGVLFIPVYLDCLTMVKSYSVIFIFYP
jgi:hypothetical protein